MYDVVQVNNTQPADWAPTAEQHEHAVRNQAYVPGARPALPAATVPASPVAPAAG